MSRLQWWRPWPSLLALPTSWRRYPGFKLWGSRDFVPSRNCVPARLTQFRKALVSTWSFVPLRRAPGFLAIGTGGHFKGKDPNVPIARLAREWVDGALVVYVGQAGTRSAGTLRKRIHQMIRFGEGSPVGHWGGRLVWQLEDAAALQVCWKVVRDTTARTAEKELIGAFKLIRGGRRPFANLRY